MKSGSNPAPANLPADLLALWERRTAELNAGQVALAAEAFACLLRLRAVRQTLDAEGLTITSQRSGLTRAHPLLAHETTLRKQFGVLWKSAGLTRLTMADLRDAKT